MLLAITAASTVLLLRFCQYGHPANINMAAFCLHDDEDEEEENDGVCNHHILPSKP